MSSICDGRRAAARGGAGRHQDRLVDGKPKVSGNPKPGLLARLREHKAAIAGILRGDACRHCGDRWLGPARPASISPMAQPNACAAQIARLATSSPPPSVW